MSDAKNYIESVGEVTTALSRGGYLSVLIGGMALVVMGSRRVTKGFDFLISKEARSQKLLLNILYKKGLELASKTNEQGDITQTISDKKTAYSRLQIDKPASAYFINPKTGLRIDFFFGFPESIEKIKDPQKIKVCSHTFYVASKDDLIKHKKQTIKNRKLAVDQQDLEFLKKV
jgi:hypothetical protein